MMLHLSVNLAISADGKISDADQRPSGWTSRRDHQRLIELRKGADALLVGRATLLADRMTMVIPGAAFAPLRCVVSRFGEIPCDHPILHSEGGPIHVLCTEQVRPLAKPSNVTYHAGTIQNFLSSLLHEQGARRIHCEGGGSLVRSLLELDLVHELHLTIAGHTIFGGNSSPTATGVPDLPGLERSYRFELSHFEEDPVNGECYLSYTRKNRSQ